MKYNNEDEVKRALGIESWRNLSKGKMIKFAAMMPDMDREVALKIVQQFPVFTKFAMDLVDAMEKAHESTLSANKQSQDHVYQALQDIREILKGELNKDGLSWEQKEQILDKIMETGRMASQKDSENKQFVAAMLNKVAFVAVAGLALAVAFVGGKFTAESKDSPEDSPDNHESSLKA